MPSLTTQVGESVRIGEHVTVTLLRLRGGAIQIGITAPKDLPVHREEIQARVQAMAEDVDARESHRADREVTAV